MSTYIYIDLTFFEPYCAAMIIDIVRKCADALGSQVALARAINVTPPTLHTWKRIPAERCLEIEAATGGKVTRHELRPDLYPQEAA